MAINMNKKISRRQFLEGMGVGAVALGLAGCGVDVKSDNTATTNQQTTTQPSTPASSATTAKPVEETTTTVNPNANTLVVAQGSDPEALIAKGLEELGGIGQFVKSGNIVVIKPNFSVPRKPDEAATTNPQLVSAVVKQCLDAGAKEVRVIDFPFSGGTCLNISGIKDAVEAAGGKAYNINKESHYESVNMGGEILKDFLFSKDVLEADVFINMPILKNHMMTEVTMSLKNMMGLIFDRGRFHSTDLNQCIAELSAYRKADLIIMDAIRGIVDRGPTGPGTIKEWNQVVFGFDPVAVDTYGTQIYGVDANEIGYITAAAKVGVGEMDLSKITIKNVTA